MPARAVIRRVVFRPAAVRDLARLDRVVQARIDAALVRFAATGHGDVKSLKDRPGELPPVTRRYRHSPARCLSRDTCHHLNSDKITPSPTTT